MKSGIIIIPLLLAYLTAIGQIDMSDSTVQAITYWDEGEKRNYDVTLKKIILKDADTLSVESTNYDVEVTVLKAEAKSYTIQWYYSNFTTDSPTPVVQKLVGIGNDINVLFRIDEFGVFMEVINWKEIRKYIEKALESLGKDIQHFPGSDEFIKQTQHIYSTKEAIEAGSIMDIHQFHAFYGVAYKLDEKMEGSLQVPNMFDSAEPFDATMSFYLDKIDAERDNYTLQARQEISKEQVQKATFDYLTKLAGVMNTDPPDSEVVAGMGKEVLLYTSRINGHGWVEHSVQKKSVTMKDISNITERIIVLK